MDVEKKSISVDGEVKHTTYTLKTSPLEYATIIRALELLKKSDNKDDAREAGEMCKFLKRFNKEGPDQEKKLAELSKEI